LTLPASTHVEHAETVTGRQVLDEVKCLESATSEAMQIDNAGLIDFLSLGGITMSDEGAFDSLVPSVLHSMEIFNEELIFGDGVRCVISSLTDALFRVVDVSSFQEFFKKGVEVARSSCHVLKIKMGLS
jgi:hypothetical protein